MNAVLKVIKDRKSVRVFTGQKIPEEIKQEILNAAFEAPTAGAMMLYSILDIKDPEKKEQLAVTCDHQPFIAKAPLILIFLADYQRWYDAYCLADCQPRKPGEGDLFLAFADALIAAQNTVIAAESLGVGSCYIGDILENCATVRTLLDLPDYVMPAAMVVFGYPTAGQKKRRKPARFAEEYLVFTDQYRRLSKEEHWKMHTDRNRSDGFPVEKVEDYIKRRYKQKYNVDFALEMNRSAGEYLEKFLTRTKAQGEH